MKVYRTTITHTHRHTHTRTWSPLPVARHGRWRSPGPTAHECPWALHSRVSFAHSWPSAHVAPPRGEPFHHRGAGGCGQSPPPYHAEQPQASHTKQVEKTITKSVTHWKIILPPSKKIATYTEMVEQMNRLPILNMLSLIRSMFVNIKSKLVCTALGCTTGKILILHNHSNLHTKKESCGNEHTTTMSMTNLRPSLSWRVRCCCLQKLSWACGSRHSTWWWWLNPEHSGSPEQWSEGNQNQYQSDWEIISSIFLYHKAIP